MLPDRSFDSFVRLANHSMLIVTAQDDTEQGGCLVGFHTQVSIEPLRYAVCLSKRNHTFRVAQGADTLGVHLLKDTQMELAEAFGGRSDADVPDKFRRFGWRSHQHSRTPILGDVTDWFVGQICERLDTGDHVVFVLDPIDADSRSDDDTAPLRFGSVGCIDPGQDP